MGAKKKAVFVSSWRRTLSSLFTTTLLFSFIALAAGSNTYAANECGPASPGGTVTCAATGSPYSSGITYTGLTGGGTFNFDGNSNGTLTLTKIVPGPGSTALPPNTGVSIGGQGAYTLNFAGPIDMILDGRPKINNIGFLFDTTDAGNVVINASSADTQFNLTVYGGTPTSAPGLVGFGNDNFSSRPNITADLTGMNLSVWGGNATGIEFNGRNVSLKTGNITMFADSTNFPNLDAAIDITASSSINVDTSAGDIAVFKSNPNARGNVGVRLVNSSGNIVATTGNIFVESDYGLGIQAVRPRTNAGGITIDTVAGTNVTVSGIASTGIHTDNLSGQVQIDANGSVFAAGQNSLGVRALSRSGDAVTVNVGDGAVITGGWQVDPLDNSLVFATQTQSYSSPASNNSPGAAAGILLGSVNGTAVLNNSGTIGAGTDRAAESLELFLPQDQQGGPMATQINNAGTIVGTVTLGSGVNQFTNQGVYDLRAFADTNGDGVRDTLGVAVSNLGTSGDNTMNNTGTIALLGIGNANHDAVTLNAAGQYLPLAAGTVAGALPNNPHNAMTPGGPVQGQILGVQTFTNSGIIDLTANPVAGDVLVISGGQTAGQNGWGVFVTGGKVLVDTVLNGGFTDAQSDILVVDSTRIGSGATLVEIHNASPNNGAVTIGNGIPVVEVLNKEASVDGAFKLGGRVADGAYEYDLYHNGVSVVDGNWYLRTITQQPQQPQQPLEPQQPKQPGQSGQPGQPQQPLEPQQPKQPDQPDQPGQPVVPVTPAALSIRPEPYVYARNMVAATGMFIHTLHDRLGEPQYTEAYGGKNQTYGDNSKGQDNNVPALWARVAGNRTDTEAGGGNIDTKTDTGLVHLGGDIARWTDGNNRYHFGVMGAYGKSDTDAEDKDVPFTNNGIRRKASGDVEGYSLGVYGTWYGNDKYPQGPYVDIWGMFNWFDNTVQGNGLPQETYNSTGGVVSVEGGWAFIARDDGKRQWMLEPQVQVAYAMYNEGSHVEVNGATVSNDDGDGVIARAGVRMYSRGTQGDNGIQPFVEANVWHYAMNNSLDFSGTTVSDGAPGTRYEFKAGFQAELAKHWQAWGHLGAQYGLDGYDRYEGMAGLKCVF